MPENNLLFFLCPFVGYLLGSFPTGVVISKQRYRIDIREMGSGNIGATNVTRVFGWYAGVLVFLIDFLKGLLPTLLVSRQWGQTISPWLVTLTAGSLVLGHCFSIYLKFRGGKGVATSLGCLTVVAPLAAAIATICYVLLLKLTRISAVGSLGGVGIAMLYLLLARPPLHVIALVLCLMLLVLIRHQTNIRRLLRGSAT